MSVLAYFNAFGQRRVNKKALKAWHFRRFFQKVQYWGKRRELDYTKLYITFSVRRKEVYWARTDRKFLLR